MEVGRRIALRTIRLSSTEALPYPCGCDQETGEEDVMKKILIVNDHPEVVELVRFSLEGEDYQIVAASDGEEALKKAREENPDLVLLDVIMPKMNGFEVCRNLKQDPQTKEIPVVMLTAMGRQVDKEKGKQVGARDYITKPFTPSALLTKIEEILA